MEIQSIDPDVLFNLGLKSSENGDYDSASEYFHEAALIFLQNQIQQNAVYCFYKTAEVLCRSKRYVMANQMIQHNHDLFLRFYNENSIEYAQFLYLYGANCLSMGFETKGSKLIDRSIQILLYLDDKNDKAKKLYLQYSSEKTKIDSYTIGSRIPSNKKGTSWIGLRKFLWLNKKKNIPIGFIVIIILVSAIGYFINASEYQNFVNKLGVFIVWSFIAFIGYILIINLLIWTTDLVPGTKFRKSFFGKDSSEIKHEHNYKSRQLKNDAAGNFILSKIYVLISITIFSFILFFTNNKFILASVDYIKSWF